MAAAGVVPGAEELSPLSAEEIRELFEANRQLSELATGLLEENAELRAQVAQLLERDAEREELLAQLSVLQKIVFGRKSEKSQPEPEAGGDGDGGEPAGKKSVKRGPGARAGRRDYSHLPRTEVIWDFPGGGYCCPECGEPFTLLGDHVIEQLDWQVTVRLLAHCRRRYRRA